MSGSNGGYAAVLPTPSNLYPTQQTTYYSSGFGLPQTTNQYTTFNGAFGGAGGSTGASGFTGGAGGYGQSGYIVIQQVQ
jgi:hypothetical protein